MPLQRSFGRLISRPVFIGGLLCPFHKGRIGGGLETLPLALLLEFGIARFSRKPGKDRVDQLGDEPHVAGHYCTDCATGFGLGAFDLL